MNKKIYESVKIDVIYMSDSDIILTSPIDTPMNKFDWASYNSLLK